MFRRIAIISLLSLSAFSAMAAESAPPAEPSRKIDFTTVLLNLDGLPFEDCKKASKDGSKCEDGFSVPMTLGRMAANALSVPDRAITYADQTLRGRLSSQVIDGNAVELSVDDIKLIKDQIAKLGFNAVAVFHATQILDPASIK